MSKKTVCKTICQHNKKPVSREDMGKLLEVAEDYRRVKNYVYDRFGGIGSLSKLYPGYTVQNEMTKSGLRAELGLPSVYFYLAVFDALGDIKSQWTRTKSRLLERVGANEGFSENEKHYLRFLIRVSNAFEAVLNQKPIKLPRDIWENYEKLAALVDQEKLHRYLCRQVRKIHVKLHTDLAEGFSLTERAYRYGKNGEGEDGIHISIKEKRKRIFLPLTDHNHYQCQIYLKLYPKEGKAKIHVPVNVAVKNHRNYENYVGIAMGIFTMVTTDQGHCYGENLGKYQTEYARWLQEQAKSYDRNKKTNPGRKKYQNKKHRFTEQLHGYINQELNCFLQTEKPQVVYMVKLPRSQAGGVNRKINYSVTVWQRGYIRKRLEQKCQEQSIQLVEVLGKNVSRECSRCKKLGDRANGIFRCGHCGYEGEEKINTARNVLRRGMEGMVVN